VIPTKKVKLTSQEVRVRLQSRVCLGYCSRLCLVLGTSFLARTWHSLSLSLLGSTAQLRPWPPPQSSSVIRLNFLEASRQFSFLQGRVVAPRPTPTLEDQASVFISPRGRVAQLYPQAPGTNFSRLLTARMVYGGTILIPWSPNGTNCYCLLH
jgi:hypothetical protein